MRGLALCGLPLCAIALVACGTSETPTGAVDVHFVESAIVSPGTIHSGDMVMVQVVLTNITDSPHTYNPNFCLPFVATDSGNNIVSPNVFCSAVLKPPVTLGAHEQLLIEKDWVTNVPNTSPPPSATPPLPTGDYTVRGVIIGDDITAIPVTLHIVP